MLPDPEVQAVAPPADPSPAPNAPDASPAPASPEAAPAPAEQLPLWQELGYQTPDELKETHTRYKDQLTTTTQHAQRLQRESEQRQRELDDYRMRMAALAGQQAPSPPSYSSLQEAYNAYLDGDATALQRYEAVQRDQLRSLVMQDFSQALRPTQFSEAVVSEFPDLANPQSPLYKGIYAQYDAYALSPRWRLFFPEDPTAIRPAPAPDGIGEKPMDMRIVAFLAQKVQADLARQEGRKEEARRQSSAEGHVPGQAQMPPQERDAWDTLSEVERATIDDVIRRGVVPKMWPKDTNPTRQRRLIADHIMKNRQKRGAA